MTDNSRREALLLGFGAAALTSVSASAFAEARDRIRAGTRHASGALAGAGIEGQRKPDLANGFFMNPVLAGDHPDPSILRDGSDYYKVSSSFGFYPGLIIWHSQDLVNWAPIGPALTRPVGQVYAPDLIKHQGRYFIYFAARAALFAGDDPAAPRGPVITTFVVHAADPSGPWSDPVDMNIHDGIDPGHAVGDDGKRYLFINDGRRVPLTDDGLLRAGRTEKVYGGWQYPNDWVVEGVALEGPKILRREGFYYMFCAEGGTGGPPTSHMVIVARSRSIDGPWDNHPNNPIVRTQSVDEPWWSRGHATPVQGPAGDWWLVYHGYENGLRTLGRQMLMEPLFWTADGWPVTRGNDLSGPIGKPKGARPGPHGVALSDDFTKDRLGVGLAFFQPDRDYRSRVRFTDGALILRPIGRKIAGSAPLVLNAGDPNYEVSIEIAIDGSAEAGLLLHYDERFFCGLGSNGPRFRTYKMGAEPYFNPAGKGIGKHVFLRLVNRRNVATFFYSADGKHWITHSSFEVAGYNHKCRRRFPQPSAGALCHRRRKRVVPRAPLRSTRR
jgi:xylan 1,4-beta-xylosidase